MKRKNRAIIKRQPQDLTESENICKILLRPQAILGCDVVSPQTLSDDQYFQVIAAVCKRLMILFESQKQTSTEDRSTEPLYINTIVIDALWQDGRLTANQYQRVMAWLRDPRFTLLSAALYYWSSSSLAQLLHLLNDHVGDDKDDILHFNQAWLMVTLHALMSAICGNYASSGHVSNDLLGCAHKRQSKYDKRVHFKEFYRNFNNLGIVNNRLKSSEQLITPSFIPLAKISEDFLRDKSQWQSMHRAAAEIVSTHLYDPEVRVSRAMMDIYLAYRQPANTSELSSCIYEYLFGMNNVASRFIRPQDQEQQVKAFFKTLMVTLRYLTTGKPHSESEIRIRDYFSGAPTEVFKTINTEIQKERFFNSVYSFLLSLIDEDISNLDEYIERIYVIYMQHHTKISRLNREYQRETLKKQGNETALNILSHQFATEKKRLRSEFLSEYKLQQLQVNSDCSNDIEQFEDQMLTIGQKYKHDLAQLGDAFTHNQLQVEAYLLRKKEINHELKIAKQKLCECYPVAAMKEYESDKRNIEKGYEADLEQQRQQGLEAQAAQEMQHQLTVQLEALREHYCIDDISGSQRSNSSLFIFTEDDFQNTPVGNALVIIRTQMIDYKNLQFGDWAKRHNCLRKHSDYYRRGMAQDKAMHQNEFGVNYNRMLRDIDEQKNPAKRQQRLAKVSAYRLKILRYALAVAMAIIGLVALSILTAFSLGAALPFALPLSVPLFAAISTGVTGLGIFIGLRNDQSRWNRIKAWFMFNNKLSSTPVTRATRSRAETISHTGNHNSLKRTTSSATVAKSEQQIKATTHFPSTFEGTEGIRLFRKAYSTGNLEKLAQPCEAEGVDDLTTGMSTF